MNKLEEARNIINKVDEQMAELFSQRMAAAKMVAEYKKENNLPILDSKREEAILEKNVNYIKDDEIKQYYLQFMKDTMALSRSYQHQLIDENKSK